MAKRFFKYLLRFSGINLAAFLIYYISSYIIMNETVEYVRYFVSEAIDFAFPVVTAALLAMAFAERGFRFIWLAIATAIARLVFLYPWLYLEFVVNQSLLTDEALLVSLPISLALAFVELLVVIFLVFIIYMVSDRLAMRRGRDFSDAIATARAPFDFSSEFTVGIFVSGMIIFAVKLALEIIDTVDFLTTYAENYQIGEIIYISISFIMILVQLLITQAAVLKIKQIKENSSKEN